MNEHVEVQKTFLQTYMYYTRERFLELLRFLPFQVLRGIENI